MSGVIFEEMRANYRFIYRDLYLFCKTLIILIEHKQWRKNNSDPVGVSPTNNESEEDLS